MRPGTTLSWLLFLSLSLIVIVAAAGFETSLAGPVVLLALFGLQVKSSGSVESIFANLAIGEILVIIVGLSSIPLALVAQVFVLMSSGLNLSPATSKTIASDALVSVIIGITAGIVVFVLDDVYLILFVILCAILSMLVVVLFNEKRILGISERKHA